jgi:hypothetical protein
MLHVALGDFDQIRNQVITAGELDIDLGKGILEGVAGGDQSVIGGDQEQHDHDDDDQDDNQAHTYLAQH